MPPKLGPSESWDPPTGASHVNLTLGGLVTVGGLMGYMKRKSVMSAVAGGAVGAVYFGSAYMINNGRLKEGFCAGTAASSLLLGAMVPRMIKARAVNPVGAACTVIGALGVWYNGYQYDRWSPWM